MWDIGHTSYSIYDICATVVIVVIIYHLSTMPPITSRKAANRAFKVTKFISKGDGKKRRMRRKESYFISGHTCYMMRNYCAILVIIIKEVTQIIEFVTTVTSVATIAPWSDML